METEIEEAAEPNYDWIFLAGLMAGAGILAYLFFSNQSLRLDESQSLWQTSHNLPALFNIVAQDVHVPLYHVLLHYWEKLFGNSTAVVRLLSLIFFLASIPASYLLGKTAYDRSVGRFGAMLVAASPFLNWYGSEARMYSLLVLLAALNQYFFIRLFKGERGEGLSWGYILTSFFGLFTHYFFLLIFLSQAIFLFWFRREIPRRTHKFYWATMSVLALLFLPWVWLVVKSGLASNTHPSLPSPSSFNLVDTFTQFMVGFQTDHLDAIVVSLWPLAMILALWAMHKNFRARTEARLASAYLLLSAVFPVLFVFLVSLRFPVFLSRYLIFTIPSIYLFLGWIFSNYPKKLSMGLQALLVVAMLAGLTNQALSAEVPVKENYEQAVGYIEQHSTPEDVIILSAPFTIYPVSYYYHGTLALNTLPVWDRFKVGAIPAFDPATLGGQVNQLVGSHREAWLLLSYDQGYNEQVRLYFDSHFQRLDEKTFSPGLELLAYQIRYR